MNKILITGGAGFIGSNLVDHFLNLGYEVVVLDDLSTGFEHNIKHHYKKDNFQFIHGDIRDMEICRVAVEGCDYVLHQAALGSVPRSINDPATTNEVNISGFVNMLIAARNEGVNRFVYAASSSTYGDSKKLPKIEDEIGKPLSPYAITKYVNELYADVFAKTYDMQCIGLRYFNVFGKRQDPNGAYAAVIPLWVKALLNNQQPRINGDGSYSRDFTYIENVIQANYKALFTQAEELLQARKDYYNLQLEEHKYFKANVKTPGMASQQPEASQEANKKHQMPENQEKKNTEHSFSEVFNIAYGGNTNLKELFNALRDNLAKHEPGIKNMEPNYGPFRPGDIPHSQASIMKAKMLLGYNPEFNARQGFEKACEWYYENLK